MHYLLQLQTLFHSLDIENAWFHIKDRARLNFILMIKHFVRYLTFYFVPFLLHSFGLKCFSIWFIFFFSLTWIAFVQTQERRIYIQEKILFDLVLLRYIFLGSYTMIECYHVNPYSYLKRGWQDFASIYFISSRFYSSKNAMHVSLKRVAFKQFYLHHLIA